MVCTTAGSMSSTTSGNVAIGQCVLLCEICWCAGSCWTLGPPAVYSRSCLLSMWRWFQVSALDTSALPFPTSFDGMVSTWHPAPLSLSHVTHTYYWRLYIINWGFFFFNNKALTSSWELAKITSWNNITLYNLSY